MDIRSTGECEYNDSVIFANSKHLMNLCLPIRLYGKWKFSMLNSVRVHLSRAFILVFVRLLHFICLWFFSHPVCWMWIRFKHSFVGMFMAVSIASFSLNFRWNVHCTSFKVQAFNSMDIGYESIDTLIKFIAFECFKIEIYSNFRHFTSMLCRVAWNKPSDSIQSIFRGFH